MMKARTLRVYIAKRYVLMVLGALAVCAALIFLVDMVEMLRRARSSKSVTTLDLSLFSFLRLHAFVEILLPFAALVGTMGALVSLSRRSELAVMRAGGMSVWQILRPLILVAFALGTFSVLIYNPFAAHSMSRAERLMAESFGGDDSVLLRGSDSWLRQDGADGPSIMTARAVSDRGLTLTTVTVVQYGSDDRFETQLRAQRAFLKEGYWQLENVIAQEVGREAQHHGTYLLATTLDKSRVLNALGSVHAVSVFELPELIEMAERSRLPATRFTMQYESLKARPALLIAMVLLAATVSLRPFRQGGIQTMVSTGIVGGAGVFLLPEVSRQIGLAGVVPAAVAVWLPILITGCFATTILLVQEDG